MSAYRISNSEWQVMQFVWDRKSVTAAEVIAALAPETRWSHRTIRTLLGRLVEKGVLEAEPDGNRYVYRPRIGRAKCVREAGKSFVDRVFGGDVAELLVHFVRNEKISPEQIDQLKKLLAEQEKRK